MKPCAKLTPKSFGKRSLKKNLSLPTDVVVFLATLSFILWLGFYPALKGFYVLDLVLLNDTMIYFLVRSQFGSATDLKSPGACPGMLLPQVTRSQSGSANYDQLRNKANDLIIFLSVEYILV